MVVGRTGRGRAAFYGRPRVRRQLGDHHGLEEILNSLGLVQEARSDWRAATDNYTQSLAFMQADGDLYGEAQALPNLGNVYWLLGDAPTSLPHHQQVQILAADIGDRRLEGQAWSGIGDSLRQMERYPEAEEAFQRAIALKQAAGERRSLKHTSASECCTTSSVALPWRRLRTNRRSKKRARSRMHVWKLRCSPRWLNSPLHKSTTDLGQVVRYVFGRTCNWFADLNCDELDEMSGSGSDW